MTQRGHAGHPCRTWLGTPIPNHLDARMDQIGGELAVLVLPLPNHPAPPRVTPDTEGPAGLSLMRPGNQPLHAVMRHSTIGPLLPRFNRQTGTPEKLDGSARQGGGHTATAKGRVWLYGMTLADLTDKRSDGQDHPGTVVSRVLAQRLRKSMEKLDQAALEKMSAPLATVSNGAVQNQGAARPSPAQAVASPSGVKIGLRMGWRTGEQVQWSDQGSEHQLPMIFGRGPGPASAPPGTELVLIEENPPQRLGPVQFSLEVQNGSVVLKDEQSPYGTEVSGVSVGPATGVTQVQLPAGTHVLVAGGEGSPYVLALEIPATGSGAVG